MKHIVLLIIDKESREVRGKEVEIKVSAEFAGVVHYLFDELPSGGNSIGAFERL
jgi:hypothetical protein